MKVETDTINSLKAEIGFNELEIISSRVLPWWEAFEHMHVHDTTIVFNVLDRLKKNQSTILEFYWAYVFSERDDIEFNLTFLAYLKEHFPQKLANPLKYKDFLIEIASNFKKLVIGTNQHSESVPIRWRKYLYTLESRLFNDQLEIIGKNDFIQQVWSALELIQKNNLEAYHLVADNLGRIREWYQSGVTVYALPPTFFMSRKVAFPSLTWCASCIAHEAFHSKLYHDYLNNNPDTVVPAEVYSGQEIELQCNAFQLSVCASINAPESEINWLQSQDGSHWNLGWGNEERFY